MHLHHKELSVKAKSLCGVPPTPGYRSRQNRLQCGASLCQDGGRFAAITKGMERKKKKKSQSVLLLIESHCTSQLLFLAVL